MCQTSDPHLICLKYLGEFHISDKCHICRRFKPHSKKGRAARLKCLLMEAAHLLHQSPWAQSILQVRHHQCRVPLLRCLQHHALCVWYQRRETDLPRTWYLVQEDLWYQGQLKARSLGDRKWSTPLLQRLCRLWDLCQVHQSHPLKFLFSRPKTQSQYR